MTPEELSATLYEMAAWAYKLEKPPAPEVLSMIHRAGLALASQCVTERCTRHKGAVPDSLSKLNEPA